VANVSLMTKEIETEVRKWLRQQSKDLYAAGFDVLVKRWDKCISMLMEDKSRNKCFFFRFEYHMFFMFKLICDLFTDSLS
jgi:hypothetical protein